MISLRGAIKLTHLLIHRSQKTEKILILRVFIFLNLLYLFFFVFLICLPLQIFYHWLPLYWETRKWETRRVMFGNKNCGQLIFFVSLSHTTNLIDYLNLSTFLICIVFFFKLFTVGIFQFFFLLFWVKIRQIPQYVDKKTFFLNLSLS